MFKSNSREVKGTKQPAKIHGKHDSMIGKLTTFPSLAWTY